MFSISICIGTHDRSGSLQNTLEALYAQVRSPDEVVISDSSMSRESAILIERFKSKCSFPITHMQSKRKALPWHRWNAFTESIGQVVLFLDDEVVLHPKSLMILEETYSQLLQGNPNILASGIGFLKHYPNGNGEERYPDSFMERWLGISNIPSGKFMPGGSSISPKGIKGEVLVEVDRLWGGAMSYRREILEKIGFLDRLADLYDQQYGRGEDAVLSFYAKKFGKLFVIPDVLAIHPYSIDSIQTAYAVNGWNKGMAETWGRAHTMRWMARDIKAYKREWLRVASLELLRATWWGIIHQPFSVQSWSRLAGGIAGLSWTLLRHRQIPSSAKSD